MRNTRARLSLHNALPFALAAMTFLVTGCPHNQYIVQLKPQGNTIERTLTFYREDAPNDQPFPEDELAAISSLYPPKGMSNKGQRHFAHGEFSSLLPPDVGGAGAYTNLATSLGEAGFYVERFRGSDDLAGMSVRRAKAADQLADLVVGWSKAELGQEPGYDTLREFLNVDFRRDLKNVGEYFWDGQLVGSYDTNAYAEFGVRFGQYLWERGYFKLGEIPSLFRMGTGDNSQELLRWLQRLVARKMGVRETEPVPASLAFLADEDAIKKSFDKYVASTDFYRTKLMQWRWEENKKPKSDAKPPEPSDAVSEVAGDLLDFNLFGGEPDHLAVQLALPSPPLHSNGRWDAALKQVVWDSDLMERANISRFPVNCYASWAQPSQEFQQQHFGKVVLTGDQLTQYCLWRSSLDKQDASAWDAFVASLQPGGELADKIEAFRFRSEPAQTETNGPQKTPSLSAYPRELLKTALK